MVYIRPSAPVMTTTVVKPVSESPHSPDEDSVTSDTTISELLVKPVVERRGQSQDRRQQRKDSMLETRAGRDRRKSTQSISVSI